MTALSEQSSGGGTTRRKPSRGGERLERRLQSLIGGDAARDHEGRLRLAAEAFLVEIEGARRPVSDDVGDCFLEARAEIGDVVARERGSRLAPRA